MDKVLKLSELNLLIKETLYTAFDSDIYVVAEINSLNVNRTSGHAYLELIEKDENSDKILAKIKGIIWARQFQIINQWFYDATGDYLREGIKILMKADLRFHEIYGLSLQINSVDPGYTLGELAKRRAEIIAMLEKDGIMHLNKQLELPLVPQRIAIISSPTAAGLGDFIKHLKENPYGYKFWYKLYPAIMQGNETEISIINALDRIYEDSEYFDVVVIIRGGGSKLDLTAFDSYDLAANIAQYPLPVLTGIGHQRDMSVADMVAYKSLKTPTATADFLVRKVYEFDVLLTELKENIFNTTVRIIENKTFDLNNLTAKYRETTNSLFFNAANTLNLLYMQIKQSVVAFFEKKQNYLEDQSRSLKKVISKIIHYEDKKLQKLNLNIVNLTNLYFEKKIKELELLKLRIEHSDFQKILDKGFSITLKNGKIIKSSAEVLEGDTIETVLNDGKIISTVKKRINEKNRFGI